MHTFENIEDTVSIKSILEEISILKDILSIVESQTSRNPC